MQKKQLEKTEPALCNGLDQASLSIWEYDSAARTLTLAGGALPGYAIPPRLENVPEDAISQGLVGAGDADAFRRLFSSVLPAKRAVRLLRGDGTYGWVHVSFSPLPGGRALCVAEDADAQKQTEMLYVRELEHRYTLTADALACFVFNLTQNRLTDGDRASMDYLGVLTGDSYDRVTEALEQKTVVPEDRKLFSSYSGRHAMLDAFCAGQSERSLEYRSTDDWGEVIWVRHTAHLLREPLHGDICCFVYIKNTDAQKKGGPKAHPRAERDPLTRLLNRAAMRSRVNEVLKQAEPDFEAAFLMIDLDRFQQVNDELGYARGDELLAAVARRTKGLLPKRNLLARIGGDEFAAFLPDAGMDKGCAAADKLRKALRGGVDGCSISASVGLSFFPGHGRGFDELYQKADAALYLSKQNEEGGYAVYHRDGVRIREGMRPEDSLLDDVDEIIYVSDPETYELYYLNRVGCEQFHIPPSGYHGQMCYRMLHGKDAPCSFCTNQILKRGEFYIWEHTNQILKRHFILKDKLIDWNGRPARMEVAVDVTDKENVSLGLRTRLETEQALLDCIRALSGAKSLKEAADLTLEMLGTFYGADRAYILEFDLRKNLAFNTFEWCAQSIVPQLKQLQYLPLADFPDWLDAIARQKPIVWNDLSEIRERAPVEYALLHQQDIRSLYGVPFLTPDALNGFVGVDNPRAHLGDISLLESLSYFLNNEITRRRMEEKLRFEGNHDRLTGLYNRNRYVETLEQYRAAPPAALGVLAANINGLKRINHLRGHKHGDAVVKRLAQKLRERLGEEHVFRLGGDEFIAFAPDTCSALFDRKCESLRKDLNGMEYGVSLGCVWDEKAVDPDRLISHADELMRAEKQAFHNLPSAQTRLLPAQTQGLEQAIADGKFLMYLQPKVDLAEGRICGAEALARYRQGKKIIQPARFIPFLEQNRAVYAVDLLILQEVCRTLARWREEGKEAIPVSLNFSRTTLLEPGMPDKIAAICDSYQMPHELIEIEITERAGDMERETFRRIGAAFRKAGFRVSLDDFGSEYSSIFILPLLPWSALKIDRSLIAGMDTDERTRAIVRHLIAMCTEFGIEVVAEGVETRAQLTALRQAGCRFVQGYYFGRPMPADRFERLDLSHPVQE